MKKFLGLFVGLILGASVAHWELSRNEYSNADSVLILLTGFGGALGYGCAEVLTGQNRDR